MYDVVVPATTTGRRLIRYLEEMDLEERSELDVRVERLADRGKIHRRDALRPLVDDISCIASDTQHLAFTFHQRQIVLLHGFACSSEAPREKDIRVAVASRSALQRTKGQT